ncbi:hypothetical protein TorRG33x02_008940 [Trema orientale]|uniref:Uncharacterized protein n=1 Tax=Trema orientale TaxID=63057 RepID=A0A2P5G0Z7_TREOI|nr:hypothetical protein TorRG33x02_008940 [Trema orientale]
MPPFNPPIPNPNHVLPYYPYPPVNGGSGFPGFGVNGIGEEIKHDGHHSTTTETAQSQSQSHTSDKSGATQNKPNTETPEHSSSAHQVPDIEAHVGSAQDIFFPSSHQFPRNRGSQLYHRRFL